MLHDSTKSGNTSERRTGYRVKCELPIEFCKLGSSDFYPAFINDISFGGINMFGNIELEPNCIIKCNLNLGDKSICVEGTIRHRTTCPTEQYTYSYGIQFRNLSMDNHEILEEFIYNNHKKSIREKRLRYR